MLRITTSKNAKAAVKYFNESLSRSDYYAGKEKSIGRFGGKAAEHMGLDSEVTKEAFESLVNNINPATDERLNVRHSESRRAGNDFTFSMPKSASIAYGFTGDQDIIDAHESAVTSAMAELEKHMQTQVGQGKEKHYQTTGNLAYASFLHKYSRPEGGVADWHIHSHAFVFNTTWNEEKKRFQAGEFGQVYYDRSYYEAIYHSHLAKNLQKAGYQIERNERDFEIAGFDRELIEKYSTRTNTIKAEAKRKGLRSTHLIAELGGKTRAHKEETVEAEENQTRLESRANDTERELILQAKGASYFGNVEANNLTAEQAVDYSIKLHLERKSTVTEKELLTQAIKRTAGSLDPEEIITAYQERDDVIQAVDARTGGITITTQFALDEETALKLAAHEGKGTLQPINPDYQIKNEAMNGEQANAAIHALSSKDQITVISGGAGVGKTWSIKEVANGAKEVGVQLHAFAPSSKASREVQREEGFGRATTIADLLHNEKLQQKTKNGIIWIDEAGQVGNQDMNRLIDIAEEQNARLLLTGDIKQHNSVARGDALRIIQEFGGIEPARISKIQRQRIHGNSGSFSAEDKARVDEYRSAVKAISEGNIEDGYTTLEKMGAIKEHEGYQEAAKAAADHYVAALESGKKIALFSPTHSQGEIVTNAIRDGLKEKGLLGKDQRVVIAESLNLTEAEKQNPISYQKGQQIQFHQNATGIKKGSKLDVINATEKDITVSDQNNQERSIPYSEVDKFSVYKKKEIGLAPGDKIKITKNSTSRDGKRLNNGTYLTIEGFTPQGSIKTSTGKRKVLLDRDHANMNYGYYSTSAGGQGISAQEVIVMQTSLSGRAANKEQFYVSASRGKFNIAIYTDDKENLLEAVQRSSQRMTASEIAANAAKQNKHTDISQEKLKKLALIRRSVSSKTSSNDHRQNNPIISVNSQPKQPVQKVAPRVAPRIK